MLNGLRHATRNIATQMRQANPSQLYRGHPRQPVRTKCLRWRARQVILGGLENPLGVGVAQPGEGFVEREENGADVFVAERHLGRISLPKEKHDRLADEPLFAVAEEVGDLVAEVRKDSGVGDARLFSQLADGGGQVVFALFDVALGIVPVTAVVEQQECAAVGSARTGVSAEQHDAGGAFFPSHARLVRSSACSWRNQAHSALAADRNACKENALRPVLILAVLRLRSYPCTRPTITRITARTRNTNSRVRPMPALMPATPRAPSTYAMIAIMKNRTARPINPPGSA